jgi:hypothetical protein
MVKKKRKLSAYNRHMSSEMKRGKTFKQAVASWKKPGRSQSSRRTGNKKMATKTVTRVRRVATGLKPTAALTSGVGYAIIEPMIDNVAAKVGMGLSDDVVKAVLGYLAVTKSRNQTIKGVGNAMLLISAYKFARSGFALAASPAGSAMLKPTVI